MRVTMAQLNPVVGDIDGNVARIIDVLARATLDGADLAVFSELIVTGYPPRDLLERPAFLEQTAAAIARIAVESRKYPDLGIVIGAPVATGVEEGKALYNAAILISNGQRLFEQPKILLPTYDVFDESRHFAAATDNATYSFKGEKLGLSVCEDLWFEPDPWNKRPYACDPIDMLSDKGASLIINISASPFSVGKERVRHKLIHGHTSSTGVPFLLVNQVGGNDELVFDGRSLFVDAKGVVRIALPSFEESVQTIDTKDAGPASGYEYENELSTILKALVLGTRDYIRKCGLSDVIIGLSGGIDSAVTAAVACRAVGADKVHVLAMPSPYSSKESLVDARELADNLGVSMDIVKISPVMEAYAEALKKHFEDTETGTAEENIQARIRGNLLMALSNKFGYLPLSTGNKSELAVGYCTLYGDMSGGLAVLSDVPKTMVYKLAEFINAEKQTIPKRIITKEPSAELKPDQRDQDMLPPYETLDLILECYVDRHLSLDRIIERGFDRETVAWVLEAVRRNEHKRRQSAPGLKVTSKAFGSGRRIPIAARYDA
ncbi:MAG: NAD+ synthase [bacterium]|nr:NAD+ synthase [bacterium]